MINNAMNADEIVRALRWLAKETEFIFAAENLNGAAALIESLQAQLAESQRREKAAVEELEAEGEALDALKNNGFCDTCTGCHAPHDPNTITWCESWQWRGPQAGEGGQDG